MKYAIKVKNTGWMEFFYYIIYFWNTYTKIKATISNDKSVTIFVNPFRKYEKSVVLDFYLLNLIMLNNIKRMLQTFN